MQFHRFYYMLKPFVPRMVRMRVRRMFALRKRAKNQHVWPINEATAAVPAGWPGWPEGKKFAVVLTHDVEGPDGVAKTQGLAELEIQEGFRSSFNFIPEGPYRVTRELRDWLRGNGFEVGVHDLNHDGHLYSSQHGFERKAVRINHYIREWGASGFRAGFMLRNLDWVHQLNIQYDASTFDTDPFEPMPDGAGTIFPFWIKPPSPGPDDKTSAGKAAAPPPQSGAKTVQPTPGYVELPYTLPQDSTLFLVLEEKTNNIWKQKLDWIAARGGMVLVNVHPDYLDMKGGTAEHKLTVREQYRDFLRYLTSRYGGTYWHTLPRDVAQFVKDTKAQQSPAIQ